MSGNVLLGYARLNIPDGLWHLYNEPWEPTHFEEPAIVAVGSDVDISRAIFDSARNTLNFAIERRRDVRGNGTVRIAKALARGPWSLACDGAEMARGSGNSLQIAGSLRIGVDGSDVLLYCPEGFAHLCAMTFESGKRDSR